MEIVFVFGYPCSGKTFFANKLEDQGFRIVDVGSLVREITKTSSRVHDASLAEVLANKIDEEIESCRALGTNVAVVGIRQREIMGRMRFKNIVQLPSYPSSYKTRLVWLEAPVEILEKRFAERQAEKDGSLTYQQVLQKDKDLGLEDLEDYLKSSSLKLFTTVQIVNTHDNSIQTL